VLELLSLRGQTKKSSLQFPRQPSMHSTFELCWPAKWRAGADAAKLSSLEDLVCAFSPYGVTTLCLQRLFHLMGRAPEGRAPPPVLAGGRGFVTTSLCGSSCNTHATKKRSLTDMVPTRNTRLPAAHFMRAGDSVPCLDSDRKAHIEHAGLHP